MQRGLHLQQFFLFALKHFGYRNPGPTTDDFGNFLFSHARTDQFPIIGLAGFAGLLHAFLQGWNEAILDLTHPPKIPGTPSLLQINFSAIQLFLDRLNTLTLCLFCSPDLFQCTGLIGYLSNGAFELF